MKRQADRGSGPITVLLVLGILALFFAAGVTALLAVAGDEVASAHHAADAAALGGAQAVLEDIPDSLGGGFEDPTDIVTALGGGSCLQIGRIQAAQLAAANQATLTSYCWNVFRDRVSVSVQMNSTSVAATPTTADAEAATTFDASACEFEAGFTRPTPTPTPASTPPLGGGGPVDPPMVPPPPEPVDTTVDCGFGAMAVRLAPGASLFRFLDLEGPIEDLRPRLTR